MTKVVAYARYSSDNQRQESIDAQVRAITEYCRKNSFELLKIYQDEAQSATNDQRDQFLQMIEDSKQRNFEYIIVHKLDRFARNRYDSAFYKRELRTNGVKLLSVLEQLDDSPESVILESVLEGMAEYYSMNLAREVRKGMNENALQAKHNGGTPPLGFNVDPDKSYSLNESEAQAVRIIFEMYASGHGYGGIATDLNAKGFKTKRGMSFGKNSIHDILINEKYIGRYIFNLRESKKTGNRVYKSEDQITRIDGAMPQIISFELWNRVQSRLASQLKPRMNSTYEYLLTGKIECGQCGSAYVGNSFVNGRNGSKYYCYTCSSRSRKSGCTNKRVNASKLESLVIEMLREKVLNDESIEKLAIHLVHATENLVISNKDLATELVKRRDILKDQIDKMFDLYLNGNMDRVMVADKTNALKSEMDSINERLRKLNLEVVDNLNIEKVKEYMMQLRAMLDGDASAKRVVINRLISKILIYRDNIEINYIIDDLGQNKKSVPRGRSDLMDNVGGGEGNRTPVQIALLIQASTVYSVNDNQV